VRQWVPVPELAEQNHIHDCTSISATRPTLKIHNDVATASINEFLAESTNGGERWGGNFRLLYEDHAEGNGCALADKIDRIFGHGFKALDGILQSSTCVGDAECKSGTAVDVGCNSRSKAVYNQWHQDFLIAGKRVK